MVLSRGVFHAVVVYFDFEFKFADFDFDFAEFDFCSGFADFPYVSITS